MDQNRVTIWASADAKEEMMNTVGEQLSQLATATSPRLTPAETTLLRGLPSVQLPVVDGSPKRRILTRKLYIIRQKTKILLDCEVKIL
jgi:hypothetical protein